MSPEMKPMDPALEQAVSEIRDEAVGADLIEAAAGRVWARIAQAQAGEAQPAAQPELVRIRNCADFRALMPDYRAGRLPEAKALLLHDHLNQCVACRRHYDGKVVEFPQLGARSATPARPRYMFRWAVAAAVVAAAGVTVWLVANPFQAGTGRAVVQAVNGTLFVISDTGIRQLVVGQDLPAGAEVRTARDSEATLALWDGSTVELRERSALSATQSGKDIDVRVERGSILVQAAKRRQGHLYVATDDCRVAVTGTVFGVSAGVKGTRVSVIQGEVRMAQNNTEKALHPGDQAATNASLEAVPIQYDVSWSRTGERLAPKPGNSRVSPLLDRAPASTVLFGLLPNAGASFAHVKDWLRLVASQNPGMGQWLAGSDASLEPTLARIQTAVGSVDELAFLILPGAKGKPEEPVFLASVKGPGLGETLKRSGLAVEERQGLTVFSPSREAVGAMARALDQPQGGFRDTPCYARLRDAFGSGDSAALCLDTTSLGNAAGGVRYFLAEERPLNGQPAPRITVGFEKSRTGMAGWLAAPAPMGSLNYITADATLAAAFVVKDPGAIVDQVLGLQQRSAAAAEKTLAETRRQTGVDVRADLASSLGGEFALALDGPVFPTPSLKLIAEVYDPQRFQATLAKFVEEYKREALKSGGKPLRSSQQTVDGRTYYMIGAADPNPLTEFTYTFADGYLIAALGDSRGLISQALSTRTARTSITRAPQFVSMMPHDHYANFSAVIYQNLGATLAPLAGLLSAFVPPQAAGRGGAMPNLAAVKPTFVAAYGEPDRITIAGNGGMLTMTPGDIANASLLSIAGNSLPMAMLQGTRSAAGAFK
jgi:hypothetical protein